MSRSTSYLLCFVLLCVVVPAILACGHHATLQTAETLEQGDVHVQAAGGVEVYETGSTYLGASARVGLTDDLELGARWVRPGYLGLDIKRRFLVLEDLTLSAGAMLGVHRHSFNVVYAPEDGSSLVATELSTPLYSTYRPAELLAFYYSPRYTFGLDFHRDASGQLMQQDYHVLGNSLGMRIGRRIGVFGEITHGYYVRERIPLILLSGAAFVEF